MTSRAAQIIAALRGGHDSLVSRLAALGPDDIVRPSGSKEWTIAQVVSHLGSGAVISKTTLAGALAGTGPGGMEANKAVWARWDGMSPAEQVAEFPGVDEELVAALEAFDEKTLAELRIDVGFMPQPLDVAGFGSLRLNELVLHAWDVAVAFDPAATLDESAAELLVDAIAPLLRFAGKADQIDGVVNIAVQALDPSRSFGLTIADTVSLSDDVPAGADAEITAPTEYLIRLFTGRHDPANTPESVQVKGSVTLDDLRRVFPGF